MGLLSFSKARGLDSKLTRARTSIVKRNMCHTEILKHLKDVTHRLIQTLQAPPDSAQWWLDESVLRLSAMAKITEISILTLRKAREVQRDVMLQAMATCNSTDSKCRQYTRALAAWQKETIMNFYLDSKMVSINLAIQMKGRVLIAKCSDYFFSLQSQRKIVSASNKIHPTSLMKGAQTKRFCQTKPQILPSFP